MSADHLDVSQLVKSVKSLDKEQFLQLVKEYYEQEDREKAELDRLAAIIQEKAGHSRIALEEIQDQKLREKLSILANVSQSSPIGQTLVVPSYSPDRAIREATMAAPDRWKDEDGNGILVYRATNELRVYLAKKKDALPVEEALEIIRKFSPSTALTGRIILGLWNQRRYDNRLSSNGSAAIKIDEILNWRGIKKHTKAAYPGSDCEQKYTDGHRDIHREAVLEDLKLLGSCYVRGHCTIFIKGKAKALFIDGPYLNYSLVYHPTLWGDKELVGFFMSAGDWIQTYEDNSNIYLAQAEEKIFRLNPQNQQHELRIALYLIELWREAAKKRMYNEPIKMEQLLAASAIGIDKRNLTNRFIPRIESALETLYKLGILGHDPMCLAPADRSKAQWGKDWLASRWILLPPVGVIQRYSEIVAPVPKVRKRVNKTANPEVKD